MPGDFSSRNPLYLEHVEDWRQMRDTYRGERVVKEGGSIIAAPAGVSSASYAWGGAGRSGVYLPPTSGMVSDGVENVNQDGYRAYVAYRTRARFPDAVREAVESMLGVMHHKPPTIELPAALEPLLERATVRNESLEALLRRINEEQLVVGRVGLLLEVPEVQGPAIPFVALYCAEDVVNWDEGERDVSELERLNLVVIDESEYERVRRFEWEYVRKYRVLVLGETDENEPVGGAYRVGVFRDEDSFADSGLVTPSVVGRTLGKIPFVFVNTKDVVPEPDDPPLLGLSNLALTIYRGEADYRQALFMQGQDTLVTIGGIGGDTEMRRVGAGAEIQLPMGGNAKYVGVSSEGLGEMRQALENDYARAEEKSKGLLETVSRAAESGEALRVRVAARTASLNQIALTGAFALEQLLRIAAEWVGANPDEVKITPNLDFVADVLKGRELTDIMTAKGLGAPLSLKSIHELEQERGLTEMTWEEELEQMEQEAEMGLPGASAPGTEDDAGSTEDGAPMEDDEIDEDGEEGEDQPERSGMGSGA